MRYDRPPVRLPATRYTGQRNELIAGLIGHSTVGQEALSSLIAVTTRRVVPYRPRILSAVLRN
jgi:hypothetical protein